MGQLFHLVLQGSGPGGQIRLGQHRYLWTAAPPTDAVLKELSLKTSELNFDFISENCISEIVLVPYLQTITCYFIAPP